MTGKRDLVVRPKVVLVAVPLGLSGATLATWGTRVRQFGHKNVAFSSAQSSIGAGLQAVLPKFLWWHA